MDKKVKVIASWSGGKDSCLACYRALSDGLEVICLVNFISKKFGRCSFHGIDHRLMKLQSEAVGIPIFQKAVSESMQSYEKEFKEAVKALIDRGADGMVFGDIELQEHREWVERVCRELEIGAYLPLWGLNQKQVLLDFINQGFQAVLVSAKQELFGPDWLGRKIDESFIEDMENLHREKDITFCGEVGEYHTFVTEGPFFKKKIEIIKSDKVLKGGYWFLDIRQYALKEKSHLAALEQAKGRS